MNAFVIHPTPPVAEAGLINAISEFPTANISDNLARLSGVTGLQRYNRSRKLIGTAFTLKTRPGDNLLIYRALMDMQPGHVLVVDGGGETTNALVGELIMLAAAARGCAGFLLDAAIRDTRAFLEADFPCFARGVSHRGPYKSGPGEMNCTVSIGGQVIRPGDIIVGDEDGVVSFPANIAARLAADVRKTEAKEAGIRAEIASGCKAPDWLEAVLKPAGLWTVDKSAS